MVDEESSNESPNVTVQLTGISVKVELGRVAPNSISKTGKRPHGKWDREEFSGNEFSKNGDHHLIWKYRIIDRTENFYRERVINEDTGDVIRDVEHPLSEHKGYGSAKIKQK